MWPTTTDERGRARMSARVGVQLVGYLLLGGVATMLAGCAQEKRRLRETPAAVRSPAIAQSELFPGRIAVPPRAENPYEGNAHAIAEGRRLYHWFNCSGCHFNGGGGIGPAFIDDDWIYGKQPANIFSSIVEGRPNGMPSYRGKITDQQVWQITAYIRAMSEQPGSGKPADRKHLPGRDPLQKEPEKKKDSPQSDG
jgi:cytochrome c oxidase cbb3-type subunit III